MPVFLFISHGSLPHAGDRDGYTENSLGREQQDTENIGYRLVIWSDLG